MSMTTLGLLRPGVSLTWTKSCIKLQKQTLLHFTKRQKLKGESVLILRQSKQRFFILSLYSMQLRKSTFIKYLYMYNIKMCTYYSIIVPNFK